MLEAVAEVHLGWPLCPRDLCEENYVLADHRFLLAAWTLAMLVVLLPGHSRPCMRFSVRSI